MSQRLSRSRMLLRELALEGSGPPSPVQSLTSSVRTLAIVATAEQPLLEARSPESALRMRETEEGTVKGRRLRASSRTRSARPPRGQER